MKLSSFMSIGKVCQFHRGTWAEKGEFRARKREFEISFWCPATPHLCDSGQVITSLSLNILPYKMRVTIMILVLFHIYRSKCNQLGRRISYCNPHYTMNLLYYMYNFLSITWNLIHKRIILQISMNGFYL